MPAIFGTKPHHMYGHLMWGRHEREVYFSTSGGKKDFYGFFMGFERETRSYLKADNLSFPKW
jgi:hypothetical protein